MNKRKFINTTPRIGLEVNFWWSKIMKQYCECVLLYYNYLIKKHKNVFCAKLNNL
jgi:hypothetical protein